MSDPAVFVLSAHDAPGTPPDFHLRALLCARALRRHSTAPILLWSNDAGMAARLAALDWTPFTRIRIAAPAAHPKAQKLAAIAAAAQRHDRLCYLDADTIPLADLGAVFDFGDFAIAGVPAPWREDITDMAAARAREAARAWQLNSGVLFLRLPGVAPVLADWQADFAARLAAGDDPALLRDQVSLQRACARHRPAMWRLPANYNFRTPAGGYLSGACFVLHGNLDLGLAALRDDCDAPAALDAMIDRVAVINHSPRGHVFAPQRGPVTAHSFRRETAAAPA